MLSPSLPLPLTHIHTTEMGSDNCKNLRNLVLLFNTKANIKCLKNNGTCFEFIGDTTMGEDLPRNYNFRQIQDYVAFPQDGTSAAEVTVSIPDRTLRVAATAPAHLKHRARLAEMFLLGQTQ